LAFLRGYFLFLLFTSCGVFVGAGFGRARQIVSVRVRNLELQVRENVFPFDFNWACEGQRPRFSAVCKNLICWD
jgi:hypothetical protein